MIHDDIVTEETASSGRYVKLKTNTNALELLKGLALFKYWMQFYCNCNEEKGQKRKEER